MRAILVAVAVAVTLPSVLTAAEPVAWRVVNVHDGDTFMILDAVNIEPEDPASCNRLASKISWVMSVRHRA